MAASEAALSRLRLGVGHAFSRELAFQSSAFDLRNFITPRNLYIAAIQLWSESQLQAASVIGATSPYCGGNVQVPGCNWRSAEHTSELPSLMRISYAVFCLKTKTFTYELS